MKKIILVLFCLLLVTGCKSVKLENGENAIVTFEEGGISSDELYKVLKSTYGAEKIFDLIDTYLLDKKYETSSEETSYIKETVKSEKEKASQYNGVTFNYYLSQVYHVANESEYKDYLSLNYKRNLWIEDYGKESVTDKQINTYYESEYVGDMEASHILITINTTDSSTDAQKKTADEEAYKKATDIMAKLNEGKDFASMAKEYSEDEDTSANGGSLGKINVGDYSDEVISALKDLSVGSYTKTPVKSSYGYHIIYKSAQDDKPELNDDVKDKIRTIIGKEISSESSFYLTALIALREQNKLKFEDTDLESSYEELMDLYKTQYSSN